MSICLVCGASRRGPRDLVELRSRECERDVAFVDRPEVTALVAALDRRGEDSELRRNLVRAALDRAREDFDPETAELGFLRGPDGIGR
jgi:hypothetical protein